MTSLRLVLSRPLALGAAQWCGVIFLAYATASPLWGAHANVNSLAYLWTLAAICLLAYWLPGLQLLYLSVMTYLAMNVAIAGTQWLGFDWVPFASLYPAGLFGNANFLAGALALMLVAALAERHWWFVPIGALGLWLTQGRGAVLATGIAATVWLWSRFRATAICLLLLTPIAIFHLSESHRVNGLESRLGVWQVTLGHLIPFGHGVGSFADAYKAFPLRINMTEARPEHAYNDMLESVFEYGVMALPLWLLFVFAFETARETERLVLLAFVVLGLTHFPFHIPFTGPIAALALGHALKERSNGAMET